jgi:hypothetical protein
MKIKHKHIETGHKKFRDLNVGETFEFQGEIFWGSTNFKVKAFYAPKTKSDRGGL